MSVTKQFYYKKNRLQQLRGFHSVARCGSISKAAKELNLNQSTVTLQIQSLERDLQIKLFDRVASGLLMTEAGKEFLDMTSKITQEVDSVFESFLYRRERKKLNKVNIAVHHIAISYLLPKYVKKFSVLHSEVKLGIKNVRPSMALDLLRRDEVDMAIYPNIDVGGEFLSQEFCSYDPVLIMPKGHPLSRYDKIALADIANYNIVRIDQGLVTLPIFESVFKEFKFHTNIEFENADWEIIKSYVRKGIGLGFVSQICVDERDDSLRYYNLREFFPAMNYKIIVKHGRKLDQVIVDFINMIDGVDLFRSNS
ncbi:MAG: LysR family transcriptional regulator [Rickettsiales bacterium]|nr:LysR family transcriptional regulator [Rickettsiales bacterium]